jgi:hypothetical protein
MENNLTLTIYFNRNLSEIEVEDLEHDYNVTLYSCGNCSYDGGVAYSIEGSLFNVSRFLEFSINKTDTDLQIVQ